jgi:integrase
MASSIDPGENRKAMKSARTDGAANSFEVIAREWLGKFIDPMSESHRKRVYARFVNDVFPRIGGRPIAEITPKELLEVVRRIEKREAPDTAHRTLGSCGQVFCYGVATGRCERDVSRDLRGALAPAVESHFSAVTDPSQVGRIMRAMDGYQGTLAVQCALRLAPLVFVRPGELRSAKWKDIDLDKAEWCLELSKKKGSKQNGLPQDRFLIIPLSRQSINILRELKSLTVLVTSFSREHAVDSVR